MLSPKIQVLAFAKPNPLIVGVGFGKLHPTDTIGVGFRELHPTDIIGVGFRKLHPTYF